MKWTKVRMGWFGWIYALDSYEWRKDVSGPFNEEYLELIPCMYINSVPGWALVRNGKRKDAIAIWTERGKPCWVDEIFDKEKDCLRDLTWEDIGLDDKDLDEIDECLRFGF